MHKEKLSLGIIVPIYNVENYLEKCVLSIHDNVKKCDTKYHIYLIDDGSPDNSGKIAKELSERLDNVSYHHKENGGLSDARNYGINLATEDFLMFIDSDDTINDQIKVVLDKMNEHPDVDFAMAETIYIYGDKREMRPTTKKFGVTTEKSDLFQNTTRINSACRKIVNRKFLKENNLYFKKGILSEDFEWSTRLFLATNKCLMLGEAFYEYVVVREGSIMNSPKVKYFTDMVDNVKSCIETVKQSSADSKTKKKALSYCSINALTAYKRLKFLDPEKQDECVTYLKKHKEILNYTSGIVPKTFVFLTKIFGIKLMFKIF